MARGASITGVPVGGEQVIGDGSVPTGVTVTPNRSTQTISVVDNVSGDYVYYTEAGIEWRYANDDNYMTETKSGTYVEGATLADDRIDYVDSSTVY